MDHLPDNRLVDATAHRAPVGAEQLVHLVYELLDAHDDTARMARELTGDPRWRAHLDYLRDLQRVGRELLAHAGR